MQNIDHDLNILFTPQNCSLPAELGSLGFAFQNLVETALSVFPGKIWEHIAFDPVAMASFLVRFQRDAFGVHFFHQKIDRMVAERTGMLGADKEIKDALQMVSVRINSPSPRKTRIAAAFSLWMSACRPFYLKTAVIKGIDFKILQTLSGRVNFWIASAFLSKFGTISLGDGEDKKERIDRIFYDLTFRETNLSSLELLYCSILRASSGDTIP